MNKVSYESLIGTLKRDLANKKSLENKVQSLEVKLADMQEEFVDMLDAQRLLSTISDDNTEETLKFITGIVNKALDEVFPEDTRRINLTKKLFGGSKPHINVELINSKGVKLDLKLQSGAGLRQIVSILYTICLIEIRKGRRLLILDERLNGLHKEAKRILSEILSIFAEGGFQFIFVEYSLNDLGKIYNVEKRGDEAKLVPLDGIEYSDEDIFISQRGVNLDILDKDYKEDEEDMVETTIG